MSNENNNLFLGALLTLIILIFALSIYYWDFTREIYTEEDIYYFDYLKLQVTTETTIDTIRFSTYSSMREYELSLRN